MPTIDITIQGLIFPLDVKYAEGHVLTAAEANALNSARNDSIRNNMAPRIKTAQESGLTPEQIREMYDTYVASFAFTSRPAKRQPADKVKQKAYELAERRIRALLAQKTELKPWDQYTEDQQEILIIKLLEKHPEINEEAKRQVETMKAQALAILNFDDAG